MAPPKIVRNEPEHIQEMYIREFQRVEDQTSNVLAAKQAADRLLYLVKRKNYHASISEHMLVTMTAQITEMDATSFLPKNIIDSIRRIDAHPFFAVYDIGVEGVSTGEAAKHGIKVATRKLWSFAAIKDLAKRIKADMASVIIGHDSNYSVGKVIHSFNKKIKDKLHALAVVHITDVETIKKVKMKEFDICSIEGDVTLARASANDPWYVRAVEQINKLALGNSKVDRAGFSSAGILATIQELEEKE